MSRHSSAAGRGRRNLAHPIVTAGLTGATLAGAGIMLLLGPDSPTMRSVTADVNLLSTESESPKPTGGDTTESESHNPPGAGTTETKPKNRTAGGGAQERLRDRVAEAKKTLDDSVRRAGLKPADSGDNNRAISRPLRNLKLPTLPARELAGAENATETAKNGPSGPGPGASAKSPDR